MFKKALYLDSAFQLVRVFCLLVVLTSGAVAVYAVHSSQVILERSQSRVYVLVNGRALEATGADKKENIPVEAKDHIKAFHESFFTLDPDEKVINRHIGKALYLADNSARNEYDNLRESGYFRNLITANISQEISVDSIAVDCAGYPYRFRCHATEKLIRSSSILTRSLITSGSLRNVERSEDNPHGFLIENWIIIENKDIKTENR